jgi:hypothetical protein
MGGVIVVDAGRSRSTHLGRDSYIHDHCRESVITMRFSINCPTVICLPTVWYAFEKEASSENYGPRVYFKHIKNPENTLLHFIFFYFVLQFILLPIQDLILASNEFKGIDNPLARIGCKYLLLCVWCLLRNFILVDSVGPPSVEFCKTVANFPQVDDLRFINPWEV